MAWYPPLHRAEDCPSLPLRVTTLPLRLSCSEVQGPPILLSYYITRVISCGLEALSGLSPFWVVYLVLQNLLGASWNPSGHTSCALHLSLCLSWAPWVIPCYVFSWLSFLERECGVLRFRHEFCGEDSGPSLAPRFAGFTVPARPTRDNRNGRLFYPMRVVRCYIEPGTTIISDCYLRLRIVCDACGSLLPLGVTGRSYRRPLSPSGSGCRCHGGAVSRPRNGLFRVL